MGSGSLEIWVLWTSFQKSNIGWPQQPLIERVLKFDMNFHDSTKTFFFQNIKVKPNSRTWMTLKSSVVIFPTLEPQRPQWPLQPQQPQWPQWPQQPHFTKIFIQLDVGPSLVPKWPVPVPFYGMDYRKFNFSLIFDTLSVGGCWGQPMLLFWKLVEETQKSTPPEPTRHHNSIKLWILLPLRADLFVTLHYEIPCM